MKVTASFSAMDLLLRKDGGQVLLACSTCSASLVLLKATSVSVLEYLGLYFALDKHV